MSTSALDGASKYLNNLLLARGFLQDGKPINFVRLSYTSDEKEDDFDRNATTAAIINLIHDLVLRRDRDAEHREALAATIQTLRTEESQRILDFQRLQDKNVAMKNDLSTAEAQSRTAIVTAKKAQAEAKELKEQALKMKSTLDQVRAKCISDVRKRDVELDKLKNHLNGLNRGRKESASGGIKINTLNIHKISGKDGRNSQQGSASKEWSLENETNDFLAAVVNETSTENVVLRKIVGNSLQYLRTLTGLDEPKQPQHPTPGLSRIENAVGIPGQYRDRNLHDSTDSTQSDALIPVQSLGSSMSLVLSHCQSILRDPSFVPIEEVQTRDEEIAKLRAGWEKMADRWKEAVTMMGYMRQRMVHDGHEPSNVGTEDGENRLEPEDMPTASIFSRSIATRPDGQPVLDPIQEEELTSMLYDHHSRIGNHSIISNEHEQTPATHDETLPEPDETGTPRQPAIKIHVDEDESDLDLSACPAPPTMASPARRGITITRSNEPDNKSQLPLSNDNANSRKRKSPTTSLSPRKRRSISPEPHTNSSTSKASKTASLAVNSSMTADSTDPLHLETLTPVISDDEAEAEEDADEEDLFGAPEKISRGGTKIPRMTVAQKLAAVEAEASEATEVIRRRQATSYGPEDRRGKDRVERGVKASTVRGVRTDSQKKSESLSGRNSSGVKVAAQRRQDKTLPREKKKEQEKDRVKKARDRRRSTLTPAELGSLMGR